MSHIDDKLADLDVEIERIAIVGSRLYTHFHSESDLDIVVEYSGAEREDAVFYYLMEDPLYIDHIKVDFLPYWDLNGTGIRNREHVMLYDESYQI
ncbi:nucleotidyltransferase domain-containing protein [Bacillus sinesaloumensis]|uniref:nucleotidyltransferase domain-containing protein n=1 Tax=Litchfieldia sinesaloumensis TaxID=1926280 RepID=UPI00098875D5|nr:nucleotidyltransferase domain-containing protein [Bacillus sinesaloumensis]